MVMVGLSSSLFASKRRRKNLLKSSLAESIGISVEMGFNWNPPVLGDWVDDLISCQTKLSSGNREFLKQLMMHLVKVGCRLSLWGLVHPQGRVLTGDWKVAKKAIPAYFHSFWPKHHFLHFSWLENVGTSELPKFSWTKIRKFSFRGFFPKQHTIAAIDAVK